MTLLQLFAEYKTILIPLLLWSFLWKGIGLWKTGRNNQPYWFTAILLINTAGILEIIYLLWFQRDRNNS